MSCHRGRFAEGTSWADTPEEIVQKCLPYWCRRPAGYLKVHYRSEVSPCVTSLLFGSLFTSEMNTKGPISRCEWKHTSDALGR